MLPTIESELKDLEAELNSIKSRQLINSNQLSLKNNYNETTILIDTYTTFLCKLIKITFTPDNSENPYSVLEYDFDYTESSIIKPFRLFSMAVPTGISWWITTEFGPYDGELKLRTNIKSVDTGVITYEVSSI